MALLKDGVKVLCEECTCVAQEDGVFEMRVPVSLDSGGTGMAMLRCDLRSHHHEVQLTAWDGPSGTRTGGGDKRRIMAVLDAIGRRNVCGNDKICPSAVVHYVHEAAPGHSKPSH
jgi:hypothetical protein